MNVIRATTGRKALSISDAMCKLNQAQAVHQAAFEAASKARRVETEALNELNAAQRDFDDACADIRAVPPSGSNWASSRAERIVG